MKRIYKVCYNEVVTYCNWNSKIYWRSKQINKQNTERNKVHGSYSENVRAKLFCCAFKLAFIQLICKSSLIFESNLDLVLSIIWKRRIIWVKAYCGGVCICKNMSVPVLMYIFLNSSFRMTTKFATVARTTIAQVNLYTRKDFKSSGIGSLYKNHF